MTGSPTRVLRALLLLCSALCGAVSSGCATAPSDLVDDGGDLVLVKCCRLPESEPLVTQIAMHSWVDLRLDGIWYRVEIVDQYSGVVSEELFRERAFEDERWGRDVKVIRAFDESDEATRIGSAVPAKSEIYPRNDIYRAWPGPNSNTFVEWLSHQIEGFDFHLHSTAIGKDYDGWFTARFSSTGTGFEVETVPLGFQVGLEEGVEVHVLGLVFGVGFWPPSLKLPFLSGIPGEYR